MNISLNFAIRLNIILSRKPAFRDIDSSFFDSSDKVHPYETTKEWASIFGKKMVILRKWTLDSKGQWTLRPGKEIRWIPSFQVFTIYSSGHGVEQTGACDYFHLKSDNELRDKGQRQVQGPLPRSWRNGRMTS